MPTARVAPHTSSNVELSKIELRAEMQARRSGCDPAWGVRLAGHVLATLPIPPGAIVAGFWPLPGEVDIRPLLLALAGRGHRVALPFTPRAGSALSFHRWRPGAELISGRFGTLHPPADELRPDLVFAPLLAFDRRGGRLGYGGGYYDRTLASLPQTLVIGCGFAAQEVACVPMAPHDHRLDWIATEASLHKRE